MSTLLFKQLLIQRRLQPSPLALSSLTADSLPFQIDIDFNTEVCQLSIKNSNCKKKSPLTYSYR